MTLLKRWRIKSSKRKREDKNGCQLNANEVIGREAAKCQRKARNMGTRYYLEWDSHTKEWVVHRESRGRYVFGTTYLDSLHKAEIAAKMVNELGKMWELGKLSND